MSNDIIDVSMISNNIKKIKAAITAIGGYTPDDFISNKDLEKMVDTNDEWITARTGIKKRRILKEKGKATSYLAINAANNLIKKKKLDPKTIDLVILSTITPDFHGAYTAPTVASEMLQMHMHLILMLHVLDFYMECLQLQVILNQVDIKKFF